MEDRGFQEYFWNRKEGREKLDLGFVLVSWGNWKWYSRWVFLVLYWVFVDLEWEFLLVLLLGISCSSTSNPPMSRSVPFSCIVFVYHHFLFLFFFSYFVIITMFVHILFYLFIWVLFNFLFGCRESEIEQYEYISDGMKSKMVQFNLFALFSYQTNCLILSICVSCQILCSLVKVIGSAGSFCLFVVD